LEFCKKIVSNKELEFRKAKILGNPKSTRKNMLEMFFEQREQKHEDSLTDDEIVAEFTNFFLAGMDTTGHLVAMATYYFVMNPDTRKPLLAEIKEYLNNSNDISIELLNKMDYLTAFLKETLRMATPAPSVFDRLALRDHMIGDYKIKKGTTITINFLGNNFRESYHQNPFEFDPERWLTTSRTLESI
jgi:cytochrome P450